MIDNLTITNADMATASMLGDLVVTLGRALWWPFVVWVVIKTISVLAGRFHNLRK